MFISSSLWSWLKLTVCAEFLGFVLQGGFFQEHRRFPEHLQHVEAGGTAAALIAGLNVV
jgi:hypothetical protein